MPQFAVGPLPNRRMKRNEKLRAPKRRKHLLWWDMNESSTDLQARIDRMIAEGEASAEDEFICATWAMPHPE